MSTDKTYDIEILSPYLSSCCVSADAFSSEQKKRGGGNMSIVTIGDKNE